MSNPQAPNGMGQAPIAPPVPEQQANAYTGFSVAAIGVLIGAAISLASYMLVWYYVTADENATVTGFGKVTNTANYEVVFQSSKVHWAVLATAIALIVVAIARLIGKFTDSFARPTTIVAGLGAVGGVFNAFVVTSGFSAGTGVYVALVGTIISLVSALALVFAKK